MEDHTIRLLKECDAGCRMAVDSMEQVLDYVSDRKLKGSIEDCCEQHRKLDAKTWGMLDGMDEEGKAPEKMASVFSWLSTEMKMMMKDDDTQAAKIMMKGCDMGIQSLCGYKNQYSAASKASMELADELIRVEEVFREELKKYV